MPKLSTRTELTTIKDDDYSPVEDSATDPSASKQFKYSTLKKYILASTSDVVIVDYDGVKGDYTTIAAAIEAGENNIEVISSGVETVQSTLIYPTTIKLIGEVTVSHNLDSPYVVGVPTPSSNVQNGDLTSGSATITGLTDTSEFTPGMRVTGTGVPVGSKILTVDSATQITITNNAISTGNEALTIIGATSALFMLSNSDRFVSKLNYSPTSEGSRFVISNADIKGTSFVALTNINYTNLSVFDNTSICEDEALVTRFCTITSGNADNAGAKYVGSNSFFEHTTFSSGSSDSINTVVLKDGYGINMLMTNSTGDPSKVFLSTHEGTFIDGITVTGQNNITAIIRGGISNVIQPSLEFPTSLNISCAKTGGGTPFQQTGTTSVGSDLITGLSDTSVMTPGMDVSSANFGGTVTILSINSASEITVDALAGISGSELMTFTPTPVVSLSGNTTSGSGVITGLSDTSALQVGWLMLSASFQSGTAEIVSIDSSSQVTSSENAVTTGVDTISFADPEIVAPSSPKISNANLSSGTIDASGVSAGTLSDITTDGSITIDADRWVLTKIRDADVTLTSDNILVSDSNLNSLTIDVAATQTRVNGSSVAGAFSDSGADTVRAGNDLSIGNDSGSTTAFQVYNITSAESPFTAIINELVVADTSGGNITVNGPDAVSNPGTIFMAMKSTADANTVSVEGATLSAQYDIAEFISDGVGWRQI